MEDYKSIIQQLQLTPHPEGGFFRETYRSSHLIDHEDANGKKNEMRNCSTCIYFLLTSDTFSAFHKIKQDEIWHFYKGSPLILHIISPTGAYSKVVIGNELDKGQVPQFVVQKEHWFAAKIIETQGYSLFGCTVAPGFDFKDFELAKRIELVALFPGHQKLIEAFTRE